MGKEINYKNIATQKDIMQKRVKTVRISLEYLMKYAINTRSK